MIIRSKAPLRIGLAGGGSDVSPYSELYGGAILNATLTMYAYATIKPSKDGRIVIHSLDRQESLEIKATKTLAMDSKLPLIKGIYNRIVRDFALKPLSFELITHVDAPPGSGLGSSSTLVTTVLGAFAEWLGLPLGDYDLAHLAYQIERIDLDLPGGKQDQYAATFGGVNFMEFYKDDKVIVNPLRIRRETLNELAYNLVLYNTGTSRTSVRIIEQQQVSVREKKSQPIEAMHRIKEQAILMKEALLKGELDKIGELLNFGWHYKKQMAKGITTAHLEEIYDTALKAGATGGKISGAGGGGFMLFYCPDNSRTHVIESLKKFGGEIQRYEFTENGLQSWTIK
jgi:D-glycero-alpha-D-manno-heptose-7-phosphate kinase